MPPFPPTNPDLLLADLADPHLSLHAVAAKHHTNLAALVLWMEAPAISERITQLRNVCIDRAHLAATTLLPACTLTLQAIADAQMADAESIRTMQPADPRADAADTSSDARSTPAESPSSPTPREQYTRDHALRAALLRARAHESARRAIAMILRIARWQEPRPQSQSTTSRQASHTPSQMGARAGGGRAVATDPSPSRHLESLLAALSNSLDNATGPRQQQPAAHGGTVRADAPAVVPISSGGKSALTFEPPPSWERGQGVGLPLPISPVDITTSIRTQPVVPISSGTGVPPLHSSNTLPPTFPPTTSTASLLAHAGAASSHDARAGPTPTLPHRRRSA